MKFYLSILLCLCIFFALTACGSSPSDATTETSDVANNTTPSAQNLPSESETIGNTVESDAKILVLYFSRADENYGVGVIEKGNTQIIAEMIAEETGGDLFHIERDTPYPAAYDACTDEAKTEQNNNARPALKEDIDISSYDVIFFGYPNWWGDMPMHVYTFLENHDFTGKIVLPFCTHAGSGLSGTVNTLKNKCSGATVTSGLAIPGTTAQNKQDEAKKSVQDWLGEQKMLK